MTSALSERRQPTVAGPPLSLPGGRECLEWLWRERFSADGRHAFCRSCGTVRGHYRVRSRPSWECQECGNHVHPTASTIFHGTRTPLDVWFRMIHVIASAPEGAVSDRDLARSMHLSFKTAQRMHRRIRGALSGEGPRGDDAAAQRALLHRIAGVEATVWTGVPEQQPPQRRRIRADRLRSSLGEGTVEAPSAIERTILGGARRAIAARGFAGTRAQDIAAEAGVSVAAIYARFETKEDVLLAAIDWANYEGTMQREEIIAGPDDVIGKLARFLDLTIPATDAVREEHRLYQELWARAPYEESVRAMVVKARERWHGYFRRIVMEGFESGDFQCDERSSGGPEEVAERLVALSTGLTHEATVGYEWMPPDRARQVLFRFAALQLNVDEAKFYSRLETPCK